MQAHGEKSRSRIPLGYISKHGIAGGSEVSVATHGGNSAVSLRDFCVGSRSDVEAREARPTDVEVGSLKQSNEVSFLGSPASVVVVERVGSVFCHTCSTCGPRNQRAATPSA